MLTLVLSSKHNTIAAMGAGFKCAFSVFIPQTCQLSDWLNHAPLGFPKLKPSSIKSFTSIYQLLLSQLSIFMLSFL